MTEMAKVGAAAKRHMLAVIDVCIGCRIMKRAGSTTKPWSRLNNGAGKASRRQCDGCRQPGKPSTYDDDPRQNQNSEGWLVEMRCNPNNQLFVNAKDSGGTG